MLKRKNLFVVLLLFVTTFAFAQVQSPVGLLQGAANNLFAQLDQNKAAMRNNVSVVHRIVNATILPYIDVNRMGASVVGRRHWVSATPALRQQFIHEFKRLVINTYSTAFASYDDDKIRFYPLRSDYTIMRAIRVRSMVVRKTGQQFAINYNLVRAGNSWRIYDFSIENVSLVQSYRSQFANTLAAGGLNALVQKLKSHNGGR